MAKGYVAWAGVSGLGLVSLLLHSPYQRTIETAELLGTIPSGQSKVDPSLAPVRTEAFSENDYSARTYRHGVPSTFRVAGDRRLGR